MAGWTPSGSQANPPLALGNFKEVPVANDGASFVAYEGPTDGESGVYQEVDLSSWATAIDAGSASAVCGGWLRAAALAW